MFGLQLASLFLVSNLLFHLTDYESALFTKRFDWSESYFLQVLIKKTFSN